MLLILPILATQTFAYDYCSKFEEGEHASKVKYLSQRLDYSWEEYIPVPAVEVTAQPGSRGQGGGVWTGVAVTVGLGPPPVNEAVTVVTPEQLGHGDHRSMLLEADPGVHQPGPLAPDIEDNFG